jgi:uncharacterized protein (UPF0248 family)
MVSVREILNKIRWSGDLGAVEVWYVHRGAPDNVKVIDGGSISDIDRSFLRINGSLIPHHRVFRIVYYGEVFFEREPRK